MSRLLIGPTLLLTLMVSAILACAEDARPARKLLRAKATPVVARSVETPSVETGAIAPSSDSKTETATSATSPDDALATLNAKDRDAAKAFYDARQGEPLWLTSAGATPGATALAAELKNAGAYGLDPKAFKVPDLSVEATVGMTSDARAEADLALTQAALLYARHARGGRIVEPAEQLNSNLDRKPQLLDAKMVLDGLARAPEPGAYLRGLHPKHPQFEKLRQAYQRALPADGKATPLSPNAKRLRANMEMWRWMWDDLGALHVFNNIPEFMQRVYKNGDVIRSEKIVAGRIDKQSSIFSRPLKYVVLRPKWKVPESIKVNELWPSLLRGGGYMRQYGLQLETKDGQPLDWRKIDWTKADIRSYEVTQPPGPRSVLGHVKFSFPSQHTIYMHDTPDKWMFRSVQRTLSHGCLRVQKPMELAEIILADDKGWDAAKVADVSRSGPLNNEIALDKKIPVHLAYFTAWVDDGGTVKVFRDVYGHEKRVTQALDGDWDKINKGRDHLAPVQTNFNPAAVAARAPGVGNGAGTGSGTGPGGFTNGLPRARQKEATLGDLIGDALGLGF